MTHSTFKTLLFFTILSFFLLKGVSVQANSNIQQEDTFEEFTDDFNGATKSKCANCAYASNCEKAESSTAPGWLQYSLLILALGGGFFFLQKKSNWKLAVSMLMLVFLIFFGWKRLYNAEAANTVSAGNEHMVSNSEEFQEIGEDEFEEFEPSGQTDENKDDFEEFTDSDEFKEADGFSDLAKQSTTQKDSEDESIWSNRNFTLSLLVLAFTLLAGILVRFKTTRKLKTFMLLGSLIYLGFINGACPCMISSFQNVILYIIGVPVEPVLMLWFLGLIVLSYFFGKVWCGWVCHLGALQEFIFRPGILKVLQNQKSQRVLKWVRVSVLVLLIIQIIVTRTNIFIHYDPFKVAYNLFSANTLGYILLVIMLLSSVLIYRPFCRAICPVGLILGWVSNIPGSAKLAKNETCIDCKSCSNSCKQNAMIYENKKSMLDNEDCLMCGDCIDSCKFNSLKIDRRG